MGLITKEGDTVVASDSKSKLWRDLSLKRAIQNWNTKCVDIARSPGSALSVFTSCERLANQLKTNEIGEVGTWVKKIEMGGPKARKQMKKVETGDMKVGELVERSR